MRFYSSAELYATELHDSAPENRRKRGPAKKGLAGQSGNAETSKGVVKTSAMSTGRKYDRNEGVCAYPLEVSEIERFTRAMEKGRIVPFHCRSPFVFLIDAGHARHAALLKIGLACRGGRQTLEKVRTQSADLRAWREAGPEAIRGHRRWSGLKFDELLFLSTRMNNVFIFFSRVTWPL